MNENLAGFYGSLTGVSLDNYRIRHKLHHRYFGTPVTTWILNRIYRGRYSDIHCGMRGLTRAALDKIDLKSQSWEYASEMVLKAARLKLVTAEVPVKFYKDRQGRFSHHRRMGWLSPWIAGWLNLKVMLVYTPDSFLLKPGILPHPLFLFISFYPVDCVPAIVSGQSTRNDGLGEFDGSISR